jgi:hypothetical protein
MSPIVSAVVTGCMEKSEKIADIVMEGEKKRSNAMSID